VEEILRQVAGPAGAIVVLALLAWYLYRILLSGKLLPAEQVSERLTKADQDWRERFEEMREDRDFWRGQAHSLVPAMEEAVKALRARASS
jgi:hypothetical protein